jgi:hypothetical protein
MQHSSGEAVSADEPDDTNDMSFPEFQESLVATALHKVRRRWQTADRRPFLSTCARVYK